MTLQDTICRTCQARSISNVLINRPQNDLLAFARDASTAADRNFTHLRGGRTHPAEPCCIFNDMLWREVLNTMLMDENNHFDSDDLEESSKVLPKWYMLHIHHHQRTNFWVKNRVRQAAVLCIFLSITEAPTQLLWNLKWDLQRDKEDSQDLWCYQETSHCQKASCTTSWERNMYAGVWRRVPLKLWPAWIKASGNTSNHFTGFRSKNEENTYLTCPDFQDGKSGGPSQRCRLN